MARFAIISSNENWFKENIFRNRHWPRPRCFRDDLVPCQHSSRLHPKRSFCLRFAAAVDDELLWHLSLCALLTMGKLGDAYGRKKLYLYGLVTALLASLLGGFATRIEFLIACMGLFGLAGSMILPLSQALLVHQFPENQKAKAVTLWSIFASLSLACGPIVSGLILNWLEWHWIYWIDIPLILVAIASVYFLSTKRKSFINPIATGPELAF